MEQSLESLVEENTNATQAMLRSLAATPDDRLNWSPSPTARTPLHLVAHAANVIEMFMGMVTGHPMPPLSPEEVDAHARSWESQFTTRAQAQDLLEKNSAAFIDCLGRLTSQQLDSMVDLPFGWGPAPVRMVASLPAGHTRYHQGQLDYIQTIYGDRDWHMPAGG